MDQRDQDDGLAVVRALPRQELLDSAQAAEHLGLTPRLFGALRVFRCGPVSLTIRSQRLYRRSELDRMREQWCAAVHVRPEGRPSLGADAEDRPSTPYQSRSLPYPLDPLMRILALRAIRHRIVVSIFWTMAIIGGGICLILY